MKIIPAITITALVIGIGLKDKIQRLYTYEPSQGIVQAEEPTPTPVVAPLDAEVIAQIAIEFAEHDRHIIKQAIDVAYGECGIRWNAVSKPNKNGTIDWGVFQINDVHTKRFGPLFKTDWKENIRVAHKLYDQQGWNPWVFAKKIGLTK